MLTDDEQFENNLMPKLIDDCKYAKAHGETNYDFGIEKVRKFLNEGGFSIRAWENNELKDRLSFLVRKGLIQEISSGRYTLPQSGSIWGKK